MSASTALDEIKRSASDFPVEDLLLRRWSPRAFSDRPVSESDLRTLFTAACWAASSYNEQPWRFVLGRRGDETWDKILRCLVEANQAWAKSAPVLYAGFAKRTFSYNGEPNTSASHDVGAASANLSIQATALGLHTHGMVGYDAQALRESFDVPSDYDPTACWALGYLGDVADLPEKYQAMEKEPRQRKGLGEVVFGRWDSPAF